MRDLMDLNLAELEGVLREWGYPAFHARSIFGWLYQKKAQDFQVMSNLPLELRRKLGQEFRLFNFHLTEKAVSRDQTIKFLFELADKQRIEAVSIPTEKRLTACISSQAGCKFACAFCASGLLGFTRNLSCAEILEQVLRIKNHHSDRSLTHIVFMGTGEPLDNYEAVLKAVRLVNAKEGLGIGARRITLSTCGIIPGINRLAEENLQIELSVSLHAPDQATRTRLLPVNRKYPLAKLLEACQAYILKTGRQITFEYILIKGVNSDLQNARKLGKILAGLKLCKVNLIASNCIKELGVEPPRLAEIASFREVLLNQGLPVTLRKPRGQDIDAACGQLRLRHEKG